MKTKKHPTVELSDDCRVLEVRANGDIYDESEGAVVLTAREVEKIAAHSRYLAKQRMPESLLEVDYGYGVEYFNGNDGHDAGTVKVGCAWASPEEVSKIARLSLLMRKRKRSKKR